MLKDKGRFVEEVIEFIEYEWSMSEEGEKDEFVKEMEELRNNSEMNDMDLFGGFSDGYGGDEEEFEEEFWLVWECWIRM